MEGCYDVLKPGEIVPLSADKGIKMFKERYWLRTSLGGGEWFRPMWSALEADRAVEQAVSVLTDFQGPAWTHAELLDSETKTVVKSWKREISATEV